MVLQGNLVIVLNEPKTSNECTEFARAVFEFPQDCFIICKKEQDQGEFKSALKDLNKSAAADGRNLLIVEEVKDVLDLYKPEVTFHVDSNKKEKFDPHNLVHALYGGKFVMLVFGEKPQGIERIGIEFPLHSSALVTVVLYELHKQVRLLEEGMADGEYSPEV